jgi:hypothetical protein
LACTAVYTLFYRLRNLGNEIAVDVQFVPPQAVRGNDVNFILSCKSNKTRKIDSLQGSLICKRFNGYKGDWLDWSDLPILSRGEVEERIVFSFGKDLILAEGDSNRYEGYIPIPAESFPTDNGNLLQVHWRFQAKIFSKGFAPAVFNRELTVLMQNHPDAFISRTTENQDLPDITGSKKGVMRQNVQLVFSDSGGKTPKQNKESNLSSFGYLELEDDKKQGQ